MATRREIVRTIRTAIASIYEPCEAEAVAREAVCRLLNEEFSKMVANYDCECVIPALDDVVERLSQGCPVQYVTGVAEFFDMDFVVREGVLIPRPETEDLVMLISQNVAQESRILDVCTGSGAIAMSLAHALPQSHVEAFDISDVAIATAQENALRHGVDVKVHKADALTLFEALGEFDVMVSNPPYVPQSDLQTMPCNVRDYEPHLALFVPDDDPLRFYRSIAENGLNMLADGGHLFFEIYEMYGEQTCDMLREMGYKQVRLLHDRFDKPRMVWSRR